MSEIKDEVVGRFIKKNKSNPKKSIFITVSQNASTINLQFNSERKMISQNQESNESLNVGKLLHEIIQSKLLECNFEFIENRNRITNDIELIKDCINCSTVVVVDINKQFISRLSVESITNIGLLSSWDTCFADNFN
jgi:hypothetical protein